MVAIINFAERLARLIQVEIKNGSKLEDVVLSSIMDANLDGITWNMIQIAISLLINNWTHGDELRSWREKHQYTS